MGALYSATLKAVRSRYTGGGITLPMALGGHVANAIPQGRAVVTRASYEEDANSLVTVAVGAGDIIFGAHRVHSDSGGEIEEAWTSTREGLALTKAGLTANLNAEGFQRVMNEYFDVLAYYKTVQSFNPMAGTEFSSYPRINRPRPPLPRQLHFIGAATGPKDNIIARYPIRIECKKSSGSWDVSDEMDSLQTYDDGIIDIPMLRLFPLTFNSDGTQRLGNWRWTTTQFNVVGGQLSITKQPIRFTAAFGGDTRLTSSASLPGHAIGGSDFSGIVPDTPDSDRISIGYRKVHYVDLGRLYQLWLSYQAYPIPQSLGGGQATDFLTRTDALRSDKLLLDSHVRRILYEYGRLVKRGRLIFDGNLVSSLEPGTPIKALTPLGPDAGTIPDFPIRAIVNRVCMYSGPEGPRTEVFLQ